jgi:hypothetical protein
MKTSQSGLLLAAALVAAALAGCRFSYFGDGITGSGNLVTTNLVFSGFQAVEAGSAFVVNIKSGDHFAVSVTTDDNIIDKVLVTRDGSWLRLGVKSDSGISPTRLGAEITLPNLTGVSASGATHLTFASFKTDHFTVEASGASHVEGAVEAERAHVECSGASKVTLSGSVSKIELNGNGASRLDCAGLMAKQSDLDLSGASKAVIHVTEEMNYQLSGASHLDYSGQPRIGRNECSGASNAHQE